MRTKLLGNTCRKKRRKNSIAVSVIWPCLPPRDLTEFEARFAYEPACRDLLVPTLLAGKFSVAPSSEE
jgi:hypothetical protein